MQEPKEEPWNDFSSMLPGNEVSYGSDEMFDEVKEEPLIRFSYNRQSLSHLPLSSFRVKDEPIDELIHDDQILQPNFIGDNDYKKEEMLDYENFLVEERNLGDKHSLSVHDEPLSSDLTNQHDNFSMIHERDGSIRSLSGPVYYHKCILCKAYPKDVANYARHLVFRHKSSLKANGIYLLCSCGLTFCSHIYPPDHRNECDGRSFTIHYLTQDEESIRDDVNAQAEDSSKAVSYSSHSLFFPEPLVIDDHDYCTKSEMINRSFFNRRDTEIKCHECEIRSYSVSSWLSHLTKKHFTTPVLAGVALLCECGHETYSDYHRTVCNIANFTVIRKDVESMYRLEDEKAGNLDLVKKIRQVVKRSDTVLKCPECEYRTYSGGSWVMHLRHKHSTTPALSGLALRCECGHESLSAEHSSWCNVANFTVVRKREGPIGRLNELATTHSKCVLCEAYPKTLYGYTTHLRVYHKSTLNDNGIYLLCSCGQIFRSSYSKLLPNHKKECDGRRFSVHKLSDKEKINEELRERSYDTGSGIWFYFNKTNVNGDVHGCCNLCDFRGNLNKYPTSNLWAHLRRIHPAEYSTLKTHEKNSDVPRPKSGSLPSHLTLPRPPESGEKLKKEEGKD